MIKRYEYYFESYRAFIPDLTKPLGEAVFSKANESINSMIVSHFISRSISVKLVNIGMAILCKSYVNPF